MRVFKLQKPRLPTHYYVRFEPPGASGDEALIISSERRRIKLKGHSFREFMQHVVPLLDGTHTIEDIRTQVSTVFAPEDLDASLELLASHNILEDAATDRAEAQPTDLQHQWNFFHELGIDPREAGKRLATATVAVFGMGALGASAATSLAASGLGHIRCIDHLAVSSADPRLNPLFQSDDVGRPRADVVSNRIREINSATQTAVHSVLPDSDDAVLRLIQGADFVICCADPALSNLFYRINRACLKARIRWTSGSVSGFEGIVGPTVTPYETACYLCYQMRSVACSENPEEEFAFLRFLDVRKADDSGTRENLIFGTGIIGHLLGLEAFRAVVGISAPAAGRIIVHDLIEMTSHKHVVLRKPWCPACFPTT
jgi:molybdopterin-synthase adenylyltransferase